ncbi:MAG: hypothetical protein R3185_03905, partial [Candidatus Thermoplasmatota archaeon]|nr:hypothetical protein [Candidatus Thermoplasmatota archaeon]
MRSPAVALTAFLALTLLLGGVTWLVPGGQAQGNVGATTVDLSLPTLPRPVPPDTTQQFNVTVRYQ